MKQKLILNKDMDKNLFLEIKHLIEESRQSVAQAINAGLAAMYWNIGKRINEEVLGNKRAKYGKQILQTLSAKLTEEYGKGWSVKQLQHCLRFADIFPDVQIVSTLWRQFSWSHLRHYWEVCEREKNKLD